MKTNLWLHIRQVKGSFTYFETLYFFIVLLALTGCRSYSSNVVLKTVKEDLNWKSDYQQTIINYPIKIADKIQFSLYTNLGEAIIDPSGALVKAVSSTEGTSIATDKPTYEVAESGFCHFPVIGKLMVAGLTNAQLDSILSERYETYYNEVYVISKIANKRVIMLGGAAGGKIIPFSNPNMNLLEALALYGGLTSKDKGYNIRIIRGDLKNPEYTIVNIRNISDMKSSIVSLKPDDIIYIEPVRRVFTEVAQESLFLVNILNLVITFSILITTLSL